MNGNKNIEAMLKEKLNVRTMERRKNTVEIRVAKKIHGQL
jgi:hypothetical protein